MQSPYKEHAELTWCVSASIVDDVLGKRKERDDQGGGESELC